MELKTIPQLIASINQLYINSDHRQLRECVTFVNGKFRVNNAQVYTFRYNQATNGEHTINLHYPGKKTFEKNVRDRNGNWIKDISDYVEKNDVKIEIIDFNNHILTHSNVVEDLYNKVFDLDENIRRNNYLYYQQILLNLYNNQHPLSDLPHDEASLQNQPNTIENRNILSLIDFIKWCAAQEEINYPPTQGYRGRWGKDLSFARYFEAIWAAYTNEYSLEDIIHRTNTHFPKPNLFNNRDIYANLLDNRYE